MWRSKRGHFVIYVGDQQQKQKRFVISLKFLSSITFQELLNQYEDEIHSGQNGQMILPCSTQLFEGILNLAEFE